MLWRVLFLEGARWLLGRAWIGAVASVLAYALVYHHDKPVPGIAASAWEGFVYVAACLSLRRRSLLQAAALAMSLRLLFIGFALGLMQLAPG